MAPLGVDVSVVVLVEGESDRAAVETLAGRLGRDLADEGIAVVAMGGATNIAAYVDRYGPAGADRRLVGLCDAGEARLFGRALEQAGYATDLYVCEADLEDELIRALGVDGVEAVVSSLRELNSLRRMQRQPAQRGRSPEQQLRRFIGTRSGRKLRYASALVDALDLSRVPPPLADLLAAV